MLILLSISFADNGEIEVISRGISLRRLITSEVLLNSVKDLNDEKTDLEKRKLEMVKLVILIVIALV